MASTLNDHEVASDQLPATMVAMRVEEYGPPESIREETIAVPAPASDDILIKVSAAGVGPWDAWIRSGKSVLPQPLPLTLGSDVSGKVVAVGTDVKHLSVGDPVYGVTNKRFTDGYAEYALCKAGMMARKPKWLTDVEAASAPVIATTAWQMLFDHARLSAGQSVFVQGATGNVGRFAVQLAVLADLRVFGSATPEEEGIVRGLGAEGIVGRDLVTSEKFDAVLDLVGGPPQPKLIPLVRPGGSLISAVAEPDKAMADEAGIRAAFILVDVRTDVLEALTQRFEAGQLKVFVGTVMPLSKAIEAHRMLEGQTRAAPGKIVLTVGG